jgi:hypothetical protein
MKFCHIALATTLFAASSASAADPCCPCGDSIFIDAGVDEALLNEQDVSGANGDCCACPSKMLLADECLASSDMWEEFCRGTPIEVMRATALSTRLDEEESPARRFVVTKAALEEFAFYNNVSLLAQVSLQGADLRSREDIDELVRRTARQIRMPELIREDHLNPETIIRDANDNGTAGARLLDLQQLLRTDLMAQLEGELATTNLSAEIQAEPPRAAMPQEAGEPILAEEQVAEPSILNPILVVAQSERVVEKTKLDPGNDRNLRSKQ